MKTNLFALGSNFHAYANDSEHLLIPQRLELPKSHFAPVVTHGVFGRNLKGTGLVM